MVGNRSTHVCLAGFGTAGDIHPLLAIGHSLRTRGHRVSLVSNAVFEAEASAAGIGFVPVGTAQEQDATLAHPKLWHPVDGLGVMWRYLLRPALEPTYHALAEMASQGSVVVFASPVAMGARLAQERLGLPLVSVYTAATMLRSTAHPMTLAQWRVPGWVPKVARTLCWSALDRFKLDPLVRPDLDPLRRRLGLPPLANSVFGEWMHSPQAGLALFPDWFAPRASDWPRQLRQVGFAPWLDPAAVLPPEVDRFLAGGTPPVVFMPGSGRRDTRAFFRAAIAACISTGQRGLLLGDVPSDLLSELGPGIHHARYAPFHLLLPRARALVHHGGVGSSAQALRAAIPQLVLPSAYDQFDNAMRLEQLGVARRMRQDTALRDMAEALRDLLADQQVAQACLQWPSRVTPEAAQRASAELADALTRS